MKRFNYLILTVLALITIGVVFQAFNVLNDISFSPTALLAAPKDNVKEEPIEAVDGVLAIKEMDKEMIADRIEKGRDFLLRMEDPNLHGFHKYYYAKEDRLEDRLHTVYSASIIYTLLYIHYYNKEAVNLDQQAEFLLFMQEKDKNSPRYGAFSYSYFPGTKEKEQRYVAGTTALSIFTLLRMHELTGEQKYLDSARIAGDWLISMQEENGMIKPYARYKDGQWVFGTKLSLLYNGQSLSALSKLFDYTKEAKYYSAAKNIADLFALKYEQAGRQYVVGEYRTKNPISNTWLVMSLMDYYKAAKEGYYKDIVFELSSQIIANQFKDPNDLFNYGRIDGAYSTSGNGWISEVMTDTYSFCLEEGADCEKYKTAALNIMRWIIARTYSEENVSLTKNPERSLGGVFWNRSEKYVRTDSVCHALNGYARIMKYLGEGNLISI